MRVPTEITVNCVLDTNLEYPGGYAMTKEEYVQETLAYTMCAKLLELLPISATPSEDVLQTGEPASYKYSTTAYVFTKAELDEFVADIKKAVRYDIQALQLLSNCQGYVN